MEIRQTMAYIFHATAGIPPASTKLSSDSPLDTDLPANWIVSPRMDIAT
jgi:hypothetical protein